jgi:cobalamin biosynthetic protein CobC
LPDAVNRETKPGQVSTRREGHITDLADHADLADHGGALDVARARFPEAPEPWIDLSTGINPWAYPVGPLPPDAWERLPEAGVLAALETSAARRYFCPAQAVTVAAPGTQAIIQLLPALLGGPDIRVLGGTYGEFARVFALAGANVRRCERLEDLGGADVAVVVNPNNPDGRLVAPEDLMELAPKVGALVVDEAFIDALAAAPSLIPLLPGQRTLVLRSFGKFYGLAGLRLGFAVTSPGLAMALRNRLGPWAVSGPAMDIGARALADEPWPLASRNRLTAAALRLDGVLVRTGFEIIGGTPLFRLARHSRAPRLFLALAEAGILTRPFAAEPDWLRFGLPGCEGAWDRLSKVLEGF